MYFHDKKIALYNFNAVGNNSKIREKIRFAGDAVINMLEMCVYYNFQRVGNGMRICPTEQKDIHLCFNPI